MIEDVLFTIFKYGVYAIWLIGVICGLWYFLAMFFAILFHVDFFTRVFITIFAIFAIAPSLLTLIAMFKEGSWGTPCRPEQAGVAVKKWRSIKKHTAEPYYYIEDALAPMSSSRQINIST